MKNKFYTMLVALVLYSIGTHAQEEFTERIDSARFNQYGQQVSWISLNPEAQDGIINFTSDDGTYRFWMDNRVQVDAAVFSNDTYNAIGNGITIRRARVAFKAILWKNWYGEVDVDFAGSTVEMKDMIIGYLMPEQKLIFKAGQFRENFGMETVTSSRYLTFMERSFISKLDASRHLGFAAQNWSDRYTAIGGVFFNSQGDNEEVTYSQDYNKDLGLDEGYSLDGRFVFRPIYDEQRVLHLGVAGTYRTPKTDQEFPNMFRYSTRSHTSINRKKYLDTDDILQVDNEVAYDLELAGAFKSFMFQGEYKNVMVNRDNNLETVHIEGFYIQAAYLLLGGNYNYNIADGEFTRLTRGRSWSGITGPKGGRMNGELEVAFRYDYVDANDFDAKVYGGSAEAYTLGLNYYFNPNVKFMLNYVYNNHDRYANGKGKLNVGYDAEGNLTSDSFAVVAPSGDAGDDFGMVSFRLEIDF
jgi:phosphate-selective porin OprO/OprP